MRHDQSKIWIPTLREIPAESETLSHRYMLRAGLVRQLAAGIYTYLPLGKRILSKVESIIREEMERAGAQEVQMPVLQPACIRSALKSGTRSGLVMAFSAAGNF